MWALYRGLPPGRHPCHRDGALDLIETRNNAKYSEDETMTHGDPGKAKATASVLGGVDVIVGKMMGPNI